MIQFLLGGDFLGFFTVAVVLLMAITLHEFGHAAAAEWQGDPTPRLAGRLTINPIKHLDVVGTVALVLVGFGWGKPVPFTAQALRNQRSGVAIVGMAGPVVNVLLAVIGAAALRGVGVASMGLAQFFFLNMVYLNILLAVFNLIPIPPLDGSRVLSLVLPPSQQKVIWWLDQYGFILLLALVFLVLPRVLPPVVGRLSRLLLALVAGT